jgi:hypothetical protein
VRKNSITSRPPEPIWTFATRGSFTPPAPTRPCPPGTLDESPHYDRPNLRSPHAWQ